MAIFLVLMVLPLWSRGAVAATLRLVWQDTSSNESGFKIERLSGGNYVEIASVGPNIQTYSDTTLAPGTNYCYRVRAFNSAGVSAPTNAGCATTLTSSGGSSTPPPPPPPSAPSTSPTTQTVPSSSSPSSGGAWKDYQLRATLKSTDIDSLGMMFRYQDPNNYYRFSWNARRKLRQLEKRVGGVFQVLAQDSIPYNIGQAYALQITVRGSSLTVSIDGKMVFSVTDTSFSQGTIGLYSSHNSGSHFDNIHVQDLQTGNILAADDFTDGNYVGWTSVDEGSDGGPSVWSVNKGVLIQSSNIGGGSWTSGRLGTYALYTAKNWGNYRLTLKMRSNDNDKFGVLFRVKDSANYYRFYWDQANPGRRLDKREKSIFTVLAQDAVPYITNQTYKVEILVQGTAIKINVDGKSVFAVTDASLNAGSVALYSSNNQGSYFDDVLVEDLATNSVLLWDDFSDNNLIGWNAFDEAGTTSGPSNWTVINGVLVQSSNIGSSATGHPGTFLLH